jgi:hypothetical protein
MLRYSVEENSGEFAGVSPDEMLRAMKRRGKSKGYGSKQLDAEKTKKRLLELGKVAEKLPATSGTLVCCLKPHGVSLKSRSEGALAITPEANEWSLDDTLDGTSEKNSDYLAFKQFGDDVVILNRIDGGKYPHIRIKNVRVDLEKTPFLAWKFKNNGVKGGHVAVKAIDSATGAQVKLMENYGKDQYGYYKFDLRKFFKNKKKINLDIKLYLCGSRIYGSSGKNMSENLKKGDWFLLDFIRLERE